MQPAYHEPATVDDAVRLLSENEDARCVAGGQTLIAGMNTGLVMPGALVSLRRIKELFGISQRKDGSLAIGAMTTHRALTEEDLLTGANALLREAARVVAHPAIRTLGTIGGSICHADPVADYPGALTALGAVFEIAGPAGRREASPAEFFAGFLTTSLEPGELVTAVVLRPGKAAEAGVYEKFALVDGDFAIVSVALRLSLERGACASIAVALGSCGPTPVRSEEAERALVGSKLTPADIARAGKLLVEAAEPSDDVRGTADYRRLLIPRLLRRALARARAKLENGDGP